MSRTTRNLQLLLRSEGVLVEMRARLVSRKLALLTAAAMLGLLAFAALNVAGYFALAETLSAASAALIVGLVDAALAVILIVVALLLQEGPEADMVREVRDMAVDELGTELEGVQGKLMEMRDGVETVRANVASFVASPLEGLLPRLIAPALTALTAVAKARKTSREAKG